MKRFVVFFAVVLVVVALSYNQRAFVNTIRVNDVGNGLWRCTMKVEGDMARVYSDALRELKGSDWKSWKPFLKEAVRVFYLLYGTTPDVKSFRILKRMLRKDYVVLEFEMEVHGLLKKNGKEAMFSRKSYSSEKDLYSYIESEMDSNIFQSAFAASSGGSVKTHIETNVYLPFYKNVYIRLPYAKRETKERSLGWRADFGGGNIYNAKLIINPKDPKVPPREQKPDIQLIEDVTITKNGPEYIEKDDQKVMTKLRDYTAFDVVMVGPRVDFEHLTKPVRFNPSMDFSKSWNYGWSTTKSVTFTYQTLTVKPSVTTSINTTVSLKWEHKLQSCGWFCVRYKFKKFEGKVSISPGIELKLSVNSGASLSKTWSKRIFTTRRYFYFWVGTTPVFIVVGVNGDAKAEVGVSGDIGFNVKTKFTVNTSVTFKYESSRWSKSYSRSYNYSGVNFTADAKINAWAKGSLPVGIYGYVYYVAGPMLVLTPWLRGDVDASVGNSNQVGYKLTGGLDLTGKVLMAGWLRRLCGKAPSASFNLWSKSWTLKSGTYTF